MTSMIMPANRNAAVIIDNLQRDHEFGLLVVVGTLEQHTGAGTLAHGTPGCLCQICIQQSKPTRRHTSLSTQANHRHHGTSDC